MLLPLLLRSQRVRAHSLTPSLARSLAQSPGEVPARLVAHYQKLFDVSSLEGVLPRMNQLYVSAGEARGLLRTVRELLGLHPDTQVNAVAAALERELAGRGRVSGAAGAAAAGAALPAMQEACEALGARSPRELPALAKRTRKRLQ
jgi:hypothetical protein